MRANGPAIKSGLQVGDTIITVEGHDVSGVNAYLFWSLAAVPKGTTVVFGLERGTKISITAAKPL